LEVETMKKLLTQTLVLFIALAIGAGALAQSPAGTVRQRRIAPEVTTDTAATDKPADRTADQGSDKTKPAEVAADAKTMTMARRSVVAYGPSVGHRQ
jgi:hypothetical protein